MTSFWPPDPSNLTAVYLIQAATFGPGVRRTRLGDRRLQIQGLGHWETDPIYPCTSELSYSGYSSYRLWKYLEVEKSKSPNPWNLPRKHHPGGGQAGQVGQVGQGTLARRMATHMAPKAPPMLWPQKTNW